MNFWQFLLICFNWIGDRATRILGIAQGTLAIVATQDSLLTQKQVGIILLVSAVLTFWRGQATANVYKDAKTVIAQTKVPNASPQPESK